MGWDTIKDTLIVALFSTPISGLLGMFIAFLIVRKRFMGRGLMEFTSMLNFALPGTLKELTAAAISEALRRSRNNQRQAARMLGITPQALSQRLKKKPS